MAFETAISGLNAATTQLDIASNNIANVNTNGFKQSRAEFADIFTGSNLGVSSLAVSRGVRTAAITQQFDQGNIKSTNNNFDLARSLGAAGTPTFVVGDQILQGAVGYDALKAAIAEARTGRS